MSLLLLTRSSGNLYPEALEALEGLEAAGIRFSGHKMDLPIEYIVLSAVAAVLLVVLVFLLCYLFCRRSGVAQPEPEQTEIAGPKYVDEKKDASVYGKSGVKVTPRRTKVVVEATPTQLLDAGYTPTQLLDNDLAREATPDELRNAGYTPSQLQDAGIEKKPKTPQYKSGTKKGDFRSKPLKFDSQRSDPDDDPGRKNRPTKRRQEWDDDPLPKRRSPADRRRSSTGSGSDRRRRQESGRRSAVNESPDGKKGGKEKDNGLTQLF